MVQALYNICNPTGASSLDQQQVSVSEESTHAKNACFCLSIVFHVLDLFLNV